MAESGFRIINKQSSTFMELLMPAQLKDIFYAYIVCKCKINDMADGDPAKVRDYLNIKAPLATPIQVHKTDIISCTEENSLPVRPEADGIYINQECDCVGSLRFADCIPVIIAGANPKPWMFLLHSGFAGTVMNIATAALKDCKNRYPSAVDSSTYAWIGPGICGKCYCRSSDDPKTLEAMENFGKNNIVIKDEKIFFDLKGEVRDCLNSLGLSDKNIYDCGICTAENGKNYYSYRKGDIAARNILFAGASLTLKTVNTKNFGKF